MGLAPSPGKEVRAGMSLDQKRARVFGVLFLITFVTSIPALALYQPVLDDPVGYITGAGQDTQILFAALLELLLILANIGTAVVIFPIVRRQNEELALGYVTVRVIECTFILVGILSVLGIITGPLIIVTGTAIMFAGNHPSDTLRSLQGIATIPEFLWELFLGVYCTFKGFRPSSPILRADTRDDRPRAAPDVAPA